VKFHIDGVTPLRAGIIEYTWEGGKVVESEPSMPVVSAPVVVSAPRTTRALLDPFDKAWETAFRGTLAEIATRSGGRVVEVGFDPRSAAAVQSHDDLLEHIIIESDAEKAREAEEWVEQRRSYPTFLALKVTVLHGNWQEVLAEFEEDSLDGALYDVSDVQSDPCHDAEYPFLCEIRRVLRPGAVVTYSNMRSFNVLKKEFNDWGMLFQHTQLPMLRAAGYRESEIHEPRLCIVKPHEGCGYYEHSTAFAPAIVITKTLIATVENTAGVLRATKEINKGAKHNLEVNELTLHDDGRYEVVLTRFHGRDRRPELAPQRRTGQWDIIDEGRFVRLLGEGQGGCGEAIYQRFIGAAHHGLELVDSDLSSAFFVPQFLADSIVNKDKAFASNAVRCPDVPQTYPVRQYLQHDAQGPDFQPPVLTAKGDVKKQAGPYYSLGLNQVQRIAPPSPPREWKY